MPQVKNSETIQLAILNSIGSSLDLQSNCIEFLRALLENFKCQFGAVWLFEHALRPTDHKNMSLISTLPKLEHNLTTIPQNHIILKNFGASDSLSYKVSDREAEGFKHLENLQQGNYIFFKLDKIGLIQLYTNNASVQIPITNSSIINIFKKFTISVHGCIAFQKLHREQAEKVKALRALESTEQKYRFVVQGLSEGIIISDLEGRIVFVNDKMLELSGYQHEELIGKNASRLMMFSGDAQKLSKRISSKLIEDAEEYVIEQKHKSGKIWIARIKESAYRSAADQVIGRLCLVMDVTTAKRAEAELIAAKHIAEKAQRAEQKFLANMSHEIRTPMNAVIGMAELLYNTSLTEDQKDFVDTLKFSADSLMGVINSILDLSKIEAGKLEFERKPIDLQKMLHGVQQTFHFKLKDKAIKVQMVLDEQIEYPIIGDPTRLNQVLTNLMGNAAKFTHEGFIKLRAKLVKKTTHTYTILFEVIDSGIGIEADKIKLIFENFKQADKEVTRKYGGTGLGLAIVKQIVALQNGKVEVISEKGKGATFKVTLEFPFASEPIQDEKLVLPDNFETIIQHSRFLVVEDNLMNQKLIARLMKNWSANFDLAIDGVEALQKSQEKKYDIILMDINMPRKDGYETTKEIRSNTNNMNKNTIIIALTAAALENEKLKAINVGMNDFVSKPFSSKELKTKIGHWLNNIDKNEASVENVIPQTGIVGVKIDKIPQVDLSYLMDMSNNDINFVIEMLEMFVLQIPDIIVNLQVELGRKNWGKIGDLSHKVKSNFKMLGLGQQEADAFEVERIVKSSSIEESRISFIINRLVDKVDLLIPKLKDELRKLSKRK